jgi:RNA polymerase sigma-70 factor (ECF subfamily)
VRDDTSTGTSTGRPGGSGTPSIERFRTLAESELGRLYALARRFVGDDAEDVVQECLFRRGFSQLADESAGRAWLRVILVNCCRDHRRAQGRRVETVGLAEADEDPLPHSDSVHLDFLQELGGEDIRAVLASLPELYRVPLVLVHMAGYHVKEVAFMLEVPLGTMLARLHRGRKLFERELWRYAERNGLLREGARAGSRAPRPCTGSGTPSGTSKSRGAREAEALRRERAALEG